MSSFRGPCTGVSGLKTNKTKRKNTWGSAIAVGMLKVLSRPPTYNKSKIDYREKKCRNSAHSDTLSNINRASYVCVPTFRDRQRSCAPGYMRFVFVVMEKFAQFMINMIFAAVYGVSRLVPHSLQTITLRNVLHPDIIRKMIPGCNAARHGLTNESIKLEPGSYPRSAPRLSVACPF